MSVITLLTDFGNKDHYVAALKAKLYSVLPDHKIFDITHQVKKYDIAHAAFVISQVYADFPTGSVHLIDVNSVNARKTPFILAKINEHYFVAPDNGLISIISNEKIEYVLDLGEVSGSFPSKKVFADIASKVLYNDDVTNIAPIKESYKNLKRREVKITDNSLHGNVIFIDDYGNLITNIRKDHFDVVSNNRNFQIKFRFEVINQLHSHYGSVDGGDIAAFFNESNFLEIAINNGNAKQLLGLKYDTPISVEFL